MTSKRFFFVMLGVIVLLTGLGTAGTVYGNVFLQRQTQEIISLKVESLALEEQQRSLIQAKKDVEKYAELESISKSIVPQEKDQARTVREIIRLADQSGVKISTITFPASSLGQAPAKPAAPTTPAEGGTPAPVQPKAATTTTTQVKPVDGIPGVFQMEINVQADSSQPVGYGNLLSFLSRLERNRRTSHVTNLTVTPSTENRNQVTFSLVINIYIKP